MRVIINGQTLETTAQVVKDLIREHAGDEARVAVVLNDHVVPMAEHTVAQLNDGDRVELLTFAGGG